MLKSVLKCIESIRIKKWEPTWWEREVGGPAELVKSQLFEDFFLTLPLDFIFFLHILTDTQKTLGESFKKSKVQPLSKVQEPPPLTVQPL